MKRLVSTLCIMGPFLLVVAVLIAGIIFVISRSEPLDPHCHPELQYCQWPKPYSARQYHRELRWLHELEHPMKYTFPVPRQRV